jgi:hypothetical protein
MLHGLLLKLSRHTSWTTANKLAWHLKDGGAATTRNGKVCEHLRRAHSAFHHVMDVLADTFNSVTCYLRNKQCDKRCRESSPLRT